MYRTTTAGAIFVGLAWSITLNAHTPQGPKADDMIQVVSVGEITKIDSETRGFELKSRIPVATSSGRGVGGWRGEVHFGVSIGGGSRDRETQRPSQVPRLPIPDALPRPDRTARYTTTRVSTTERTILIQDGKKIDFSTLKVGNRVTVTGVPQGEDVEATEIKRQRPILN
jgi:hypothetical protein